MNSVQVISGRTIRSRRRLSTLLAFALFTLPYAYAEACQGCKTSMEENTEASRAGIGFSITIVFLLVVLISCVAAIAWRAYKNCQAIEAFRNAAAEKKSI